MTEKQELTEEFLSTHGTNLFSQSKDARSYIEREWRNAQYAYDSRFNPDEAKQSSVFMGQSRLFIPKTYNTIQRMLADVMETFFFDPDEIVNIRPDETLSEEVRQCVKSLLNYRLTGKPINFYEEAFEACLDGLKAKMGIFKVYPKLKTTSVETSREKALDEEGNETEIIKTEDQVIAFEPRIECVPPEDMFFSSMATWKDYWKYPMIQRIAKSRDELKRAGFKNVDEVASLGETSQADELKTARDWRSSPFSAVTDVKQQERVYDYEIWTFLDLNNDGYLESCVYHMLGGPNGPEKLGKDPVENTLPYSFSEFEHVRPPFIVGSPFPESHKGTGKSLYDFTEGLQKEVNALRNQDREAAAIAIRKPLVVNRDAGIDMSALINRKIGGVVMGDQTGADAIRELQTSNPVVNTAAVSARNEQDYFEATSLSPNQFGVSTRDETATAVSNNQANANKKIQMVIKNMAATLFIPAFRLLLRLEQAYESDAFIHMVTGKRLGWRFPNDGVPSWQQIQGEFEVSVELGINKAAQLNKYLLMLDRMNQANQVTMGMIQAGVVDPSQIQILNPMWAFDRIAEVLRHKNTQEFKLPAMKPPQPMETKGIASQPRNLQNPTDAVGQTSPEMLNAILG